MGRSSTQRWILASACALGALVVAPWILSGVASSSATPSSTSSEVVRPLIAESPVQADVLVDLPTYEVPANAAQSVISADQPNNTFRSVSAKLRAP